MIPPGIALIAVIFLPEPQRRGSGTHGWSCDVEWLHLPKLDQLQMWSGCLPINKHYLPGESGPQCRPQLFWEQGLSRILIHEYAKGFASLSTTIIKELPWTKMMLVHGGNIHRNSGNSIQTRFDVLIMGVENSFHEWPLPHTEGHINDVPILRL